MIPPEARIPPNTGVLIERVFSVVELSLLVSILSIETSFRFGELFVLKSNDFYAVVFSFFFFLWGCVGRRKIFSFFLLHDTRRKKNRMLKIFFCSEIVLILLLLLLAIVTGIFFSSQLTPAVITVFSHRKVACYLHKQKKNFYFENSFCLIRGRT